MLIEQDGKVGLFDEFNLCYPAELEVHKDGTSPTQVLFLAANDGSFCISFEEGMTCMDLRESSDFPTSARIHSEHRSGGKYIHQLRTDPNSRPGIGNFAFFHMEIPDETGKVHTLSGQMVSSADHRWSEGVEPILLDILDGIAVCKTKGGGCD